MQTASPNAIATQFLWHIAGGNPEILPGCPALERGKFLLLAFLNLILSITAGAIVAWGSYEFLAASKMPFLSTVGAGASTFIGMVSLLVALLLLASAIRTYHVPKAQSILRTSLSMMTVTFARKLRIISALFPIVIIATIVTIALRLATGESWPVSDVQAGYVLATLVAIFATPVVLAASWPSPVYERLLSDPHQAAIAGTDIASSDGPAKGGSAVPGTQALADQERELSSLFERYPDSRQLAERLITAQRSLGLLDRAVRVYDVLVERNPRDAELLRLKAQLYREMGDDVRYRKTVDEADRVQASLSFEDNLGKAITIRKFGARDLTFFADFDWAMQPRVNILLGRNGYGKSYLLRGLVALLQEDDEFTREFVGKGGSSAQLRMTIDREGSPHESVRSKLLFESRFGKVPVLAIPDMRYIDKSKDVVGAAGGQVADLKSQGALNFLREESYEGLITNFLYEICLDHGNSTPRSNSPLIKLVEKSVETLAGTKFEFVKITRKDNALFEMLVLTEGSTQPLPIQKASQGTLSVVAMVGLIYKYLKAVYTHVDPGELPMQRAIVIIDEVDAHLHPSWQQKVLQLLRTTFPNVQFIVTAHSPLIVAGARGGEVAVLAPANGRFQAQALDRHFIGATFDELYTTIFKVERVDATFKQLGTQIPKKSEIEKKISQLEEKKSRAAGEEDELVKLRDELYYLRAYEEQQTIQDRGARLESQNQALTRENLELTSRLQDLNRQLERNATIAKSITEEPTKETREFFEELLTQEPASVVASHITMFPREGRSAVAMAALDALNKRSTSDVDVLKHLATGYESLERYPEARSALERALQLRPDEPEIRTKLEHLSKLG